jgi:hypothetical protein
LRKSGQNSRHNHEIRLRQRSQREESCSRTKEITELAKLLREIHARERKPAESGTRERIES